MKIFGPKVDITEAGDTPAFCNITATRQMTLIFLISSSLLSLKHRKILSASSTIPLIFLAARLILHSNHSIQISIPPTFSASSHSARNLLSCQTSSPAFRYFNRSTLEVLLCGWEDRARDKIDKAISELALVAFLEVCGTVERV